MDKLVCALLGLAALALTCGLLHLWVRLWHKLFFGSWRFVGSEDGFLEVRGDAFASHTVVLFFTAVLLLVILPIGYALGCWLRSLL